MHYHQFLVSRELGGAGVIGLHLAKWVAGSGARSSVWLPEAGPAAEAAEREGLRWRRFGLTAMSRGSTRHALACMALSLKLGFSGGLAHVHTPAVYRLIRPALRLARLRTVVHVHLEPAEEEIRWAFQDPPDVVVPCARFMTAVICRALGEHGEGLRVEAVPNAVDTERFTSGDRCAARQKVGAPADLPLALMVANLAPHKGQETAIRAVAELKGRGQAVECWLAGIERHGGQAYQQHLRSLAGELGVADRVRFLGFRCDGPDLMKAADFLLLPSTREGLPLSILEAQASKVPVLASPTAGVPEVVSDGETGFLIPAKDAMGYADCMQRLLARPDLRRHVTEQAHARVRREHTWPVYCERITELYRELMGPRSEVPQTRPVKKPRSAAPDLVSNMAPAKGKP
jgi:glycosyltransferase involved in cell wall biosynthesis